MHEEPHNKRARRSGTAEGVGEPEATPPQRTASPAGDAREPSALERLHPDVLEAVLQELGPVEASRVRLVSKRMREAVDDVAWRSLRLKIESAAQIECTAASFAPAQQAVAIGARRNALRLAKAAALELIVFAKLNHQCIDSLFSACSASSGGLGSVLIKQATDCHYPFPAVALERLIAGTLGLLSVPEANGCSSDTLKSLVVELRPDWIRTQRDLDFPPDILRLLARFPRLERLRLPYTLDGPASALSAALPALRSAAVWLEEGAALAGLSSHPALEELEIRVGCLTGCRRGFEAFAAGPAARHLRKLEISFGSWGFDVEELSFLSRLQSLETLALTIDPDLFEYAGAQLQALAGLAKLRSLILRSRWASRPQHLRGLARTVAALRERSLRDLRLEIGVAAGDDADAALAELIRAAGPALVELTDRFEADTWNAAFAALASCPRLRSLHLYTRVLALAEAAAVLAACPRLEWIRDLSIGINSEREVTEGLEPLRRLGPSGCDQIVLSSGKDLPAEERGRVMRLARKRLRSIFLRASTGIWTEGDDSDESSDPDDSDAE